MSVEVTLNQKTISARTICVHLTCIQIFMYCFQGIMSRVYEAVVVLFLLSILACGLAWVTSALLDGDVTSRKALFGKFIKKEKIAWIARGLTITY